MNIIEKLSPNCDSRDGQAIDMLVLHYTGMKSMQEALSRLCDPAAEVSAHYMVDEDGTVYRLVPEEMRAWHAGKAPLTTWRGYTNVNQRSIGIEIVNPGHEFGYRPFPKVQMESVAQLCKEILARHKIPARNVVAHSDIAPSRKEDPGEKFPWKDLAEKGIGLWPREQFATQALLNIFLDFFGFFASLISGHLVMAPGITNEKNIPLYDVATSALPTLGQIQAQLAEYGYNCPQTGILDEETGKVILAFQRHFYPKRLTGTWDRECAMQLASLLKLI